MGLELTDKQFNDKNRKKEELICPLCGQIYRHPRRKYKMDTLIKTCNVCGETKLTRDFHRSGKSKDGFKNTCKFCIKRNSYYRVHYTKHFIKV